MYPCLTRSLLSSLERNRNSHLGTLELCAAVGLRGGGPGGQIANGGSRIGWPVALDTNAHTHERLPDPFAACVVLCPCSSREQQRSDQPFCPLSPLVLRRRNLCPSAAGSRSALGAWRGVADCRHTCDSWCAAVCVRSPCRGLRLHFRRSFPYQPLAHLLMGAPPLFIIIHNHTSTSHLYLADHALFSPEAMLYRHRHSPAPFLPPPLAICCGRHPPATCPQRIFSRAPGAAAGPQTWSLCH